MIFLAMLIGWSLKAQIDSLGVRPSLMLQPILSRTVSVQMGDSRHIHFKAGKFY